MVVLDMPEYSRNHLAEHYNVHYWPDTGSHNQRLDDPLLAKIRAVQTNGSYGLKRPMIEAMPNLEIICAVGAGFEGIDLDAAREHGIIVTHSPGMNAETVADQAWALLLGIVRRVPKCDRAVRAGHGEDVREQMPSLTGKKLGLFGLGHVGTAIARRGGAGFGMEVGYHARNQRVGSDYQYFDSLADLADWCDVLAIAAPGGKETHHIVNADILAKLGPQGFLINVARGALVDTDALISALDTEAISGAGLDVFEGEPEAPDGSLKLTNLVLSPHVGGFSPEAVRNMIHLVRDNLDAHFAGKKVLTPVT